MIDRKYISAPVFNYLEKSYVQAEDKALKRLAKLQKKLARKSKREIEKILTGHSLGIEKKAYQQLFEQHEISEKRYLMLMESIMRQLDRLERDELPDERQSKAKFAPEIPKKLKPFIGSKISFIRRLINRYYRKFRNHQILERLQHYRARRIASFKVMNDFQKLQKHNKIFGDFKVLDKILKRYRSWNLNAERKMDRLEKKFPKVVIPARIKMAQHSCLAKEYQLEKDFLEKGFISEKVFRKLDNQRQKRMAHNLKYKTKLEDLS
jgi:hypothetical protein